MHYKYADLAISKSMHSTLNIANRDDTILLIRNVWDMDIIRYQKEETQESCSRSLLIREAWC